MQIKEEDFKKIIGFARAQLLKHKQLVNVIGIRESGSEPVPTNAVTEYIIMGMTESITLESFLTAVNEKKERKAPSSVTYPPEFEEWWNTFPASANFTYKGKSFNTIPRRGLKDDKERTFIKYEEVKAKLELTDAQMLRVLRIEIRERKEGTYENFLNGKTKDSNEFQFMKATIAYLNAGKFVGYLDDESSSAETEEDFKENDDNTSNVA